MTFFLDREDVRVELSQFVLLKSLHESTANGTISTNFPTPSYSKTVKPDGTIERTVSIEAAGLPVATIRTVGTSTPEVFATHTDHLRSTRLVTRDAGQDTWEVAEQTDYDSFGKITRHEQTGDFAEKKKFTSHEFDASTSYTYAKARYLDTSAGRFASQDPKFIYNPEQLLGDPQQQNSYGYARNNPVRFVDPDGATIQEAIGGFATNLITAPVAAALYPVQAVFHPIQTAHEIGQATNILGQNIAGFAREPGAMLDATIQSFSNLSDYGKGGLAGLAFSTITGGEARALLGADAKLCYAVCGQVGLPSKEFIQNTNRAIVAGAESVKARDIFGQLFKEKDSIPGGTAAALRLEAEVGRPLGSKMGHLGKAQGYVTGIGNAIQGGKLSSYDLAQLKVVLGDLQGAIQQFNRTLR